jgi:hypothetical protein
MQANNATAMKNLATYYNAGSSFEVTADISLKLANTRPHDYNIHLKKAYPLCLLTCTPCNAVELMPSPSPDTPTLRSRKWVAGEEPCSKNMSKKAKVSFPWKCLKT